MIVEKIRQIYEQSPKRKLSTGYPTGSRVGMCTAALQLSRFPALGKPEPPLPRRIMTWEAGDEIEAWFAAMLHQAFPGLTGLRQEPFYFPVPIDQAQMEALRVQTTRKKGNPEGPNLWGEYYNERPFVPPSIKLVDGRVKLRLLPCGDKCTATEHGWGCRKKIGFVLDPLRAAGPAVWVPTYIDFAIIHPDLGLVVIETKSMSNFAFRRALLGDLDLGKRAQLVGITEATGLDTLLLAYKKDTSHLCEIAYTRKAERTRVMITKLNGQVEVLEGPGLDPGKVPFLETWETAETWTPQDPTLMEQIAQNVRDVLLFTGDPTTLLRRYGPSFTCAVCDGTGLQTLNKQNREPLKKAKPCVACQETGRLERARLPGFPCGYCDVVMGCWEKAGVTLEVTEKPTYWVDRQAFEQSGLTVVPYQAAAVETVEEDDDDDPVPF